MGLAFDHIWETVMMAVQCVRAQLTVLFLGSQSWIV